MSRNIFRLLFVCILLTQVVFQPALSTGTPVAAQGGKTASPIVAGRVSKKLDAPLELTFDISGQPAIGQESTLTLTATPSVTAPHTTVHLTLPAGIDLVKGQSTWTGDVASSQVYTQSWTVIPRQAGYFAVRVDFTSTSSDHSTFGKSASLYFDMGTQTGTASKTERQDSKTELPATKIDTGQPVPWHTPLPSSRLSSPELAIQPDAVNGTINVSGSWNYQDQAGNLQPVRFAHIEIWDECGSGSCDSWLATAHTDNTGHFSVIGISNTDESGTRDIYTKIFALDDASIQVTDFNGGFWYSRSPTLYDVADGTVNVGSQPIGVLSHGSPFYIYDKIANDAFFFLYNQVGWVNNYHLQVRWDNTNTTDGTHYNLGGGPIDLLAGDGWDEDVFLHEYGHFVMDKIYPAYPSTPNCSTRSWGSASSVGCAWVEGWADFLQGAIQNSPNYVDTDNQTLNYSLEPPSPPAVHEDEEGAVAAVLWDIFDGANEPWDAISSGFNGDSNNGIWKVLTTYHPTNLHDFWNDWGSVTGNSSCSLLWPVFNHVGINYDTAGPSAPHGLVSGDHTPGVWSPTRVVTVNWIASDDGCGSGVTGYSVLWNTNPSSIPDAVVDTTGLTSTSPSLADGSSWYFHVRALDAAGNSSSTAHFGPFYIDGTTPTNPTAVNSDTGHPIGVWKSNNVIVMTWSGASDSGGSGLAGYSFEWNTTQSSAADTIVDTTSTTTSSPALADGNSWWFHVRTGDNAGNWANTLNFGPFFIDTSAPTAPTAADSGCSVSSGSWQNSCSDPNFSWSGASDLGSGVAGYYVYWGTDPAGTSATYVTSAGYNPPAVANPSTTYLRVQSKDIMGFTSSWVTLFTFMYDGTAPSNPSISGSSHTLSSWSNDNTINITWAGASDTASGVYGYSWEFSTSASTIPDAVVDTTGGAAVSPALADGSSWYFHIRTVDNAGNWNTSATHYGPFYIDVAAPTAPVSTDAGCTASSNAWQNTCSDPNFSWRGATDAGSGVAGYYVYWGASSSGTSSYYVTTAGYDPGPVSNPSVNYLRVQTQDQVGHTSGWVTLFTFMYDGTTPNNPSISGSSHTLAVWSTDNTVNVSWTGASDTGSGVGGYSYEFSTSSSTIPDSVVDTTSSGVTSPALADGSSWYFHIRTVDNAGNWNAAATHYGPFYIDANAPSDPVVFSSSHTPSVWSTDTTVDIYWTPSSDGAGSGVAGYSYAWSASPTSNPDAVVDTTGTSTTSPVLGTGIWYFSIRVVDNIGNWDPVAHYGPFYIDVSTPGAPSAAAPDCAAVSNTWQNACSAPKFTWTAAADAGSGVAGYNVYWGSSSTGTSTTFVTGAAFNAPTVASPSLTYLRAQAKDGAGNTGVWATLFAFRYDGTAPTDPVVSSPSHTLSTWSADTTIDVTWTPSSDGAGSGVSGYSFTWSTSPTAIPDMVVDTSGTSATSPVLGTNNSWYFHVRVVDNAGNWGSTVHYGPFYIDVSSPGIPSAADAGCVATSAVWQNTCSDPNFTWTAAVDAGSGVAGYYVYWGTDPAGTSTTFITSAAYDPAAVDNPSTNYLRVQAQDQVGNTGAWATLFSFRYDGTAPKNPTISSSSHTLSVWSTDNTVDVTWTGATDAGSGIAGYSIEWSTSPFTLPDTTVDTAGGSATSPALATGSWYFHIRTRDVTGNVSDAAHYGPFDIDTTAPSDPAVSSPSHTLSVWSTDTTIDVTWAPSSDGAGSGVAGYAYTWSASPTAMPNAVVITTGYSTTSPVLGTGIWYFHIRAVDGVGNWSATATHYGPFYIDVSTPGLPSAATTDCAAVSNTWQNACSTPKFTWTASLDNGSGVAGYYVYWGSNIFGTSTTFVTGAAFNAPAVASPSLTYLRAQAKDGAGNLGSWFTLFAFRYDGTAPTDPVVSSSSHTLSTWSTDATIDVTWTPSSDGAGSGVSGYSFTWSTSPNAIPDMVVDTTGTSTTSPTLGTNNSWYFHVRVVDNVGNWGPTVHYGPFYIDVNAPGVPTAADAGCAAISAAWQHTCPDPNFTWAAAPDGGSGIAGYYVYWGTSNSGTSTTFVTSSAYDPAAVANPSTNYLRVQAQDKVGFTSMWVTLFTFRYDGTPPTNPTIAGSTPNPSIWSTDNTVDVSWSGATDAASGVGGYSFEWSTSATTLPDNTPDTSATSTTSPALSEGNSWYFHIRAVDNAGNAATTAVHYGPFFLDKDGPTGSLSIDGGAQFTNAPLVHLAISAIDTGTGLDQMQISLDGTALGWEAFAAVRDVTLPAGDGQHTVSVQFKDKIGNLSQGYDQSIGLDTVAPQSSALPLPATLTGTHFMVNWSGIDADPGSGIKAYDVQYRIGATGTWTNWLVARTLTAANFGPQSPIVLTNGATYYFRVRATDQAGNVGVYAGGDGDTHVTVTTNTTTNYYVYLPVVTK